MLLTTIVGEVSPVLHRLLTVLDDVRVTLLPPQRVVGPEACTTGATLVSTVTTTGIEAAVVQVPTICLTEYDPAEFMVIVR